MTPRYLSSQEPNRAGSSEPNEPAFLAVGRLRKPHGIKGEILMDVVTDFPERLKPGVWLRVGPERRRMKLRSVRWHNQSMLVAFTGFNTPEEIGEFRNMDVFVPVEDRPALEEGEYYHHQIIGLKVYTEDEKFIGTVKEILETGANDVLVVRPDLGAEVLVPLIESTILEIDLEKGIIRFQMLEGLLPEE